MAFRLGHQIFCNIKKNVFVRSSSADSSHRLRSLSPTVFNESLKENYASLFQEKKLVNLPRSRSLPAPESSLAQCRRFSTKNQPGQLETEELVVNERSPQFSYYQHPKIKIEFNRTTNVALQPSNLTPVITNYIPHVPTIARETAHPVRVKTLRRLAHAKYENAVKALNKQGEEESKRYHLEAAKRKPERDKIYNVHQLYRKKYRTPTAHKPQLQPKNIKPYGNVNTLPWCAPNVETYKKGIVAEHIHNSRHRSPKRRAKRSGSESELHQMSPNQASPSHTQKRGYSTLEDNTDATLQSHELEKCKSIISEYKKINPDYIEKNKKFKSGSPEEQKFIEQAEKFVANLKMNQRNNEPPKSSEEAPMGTEPNVMASKNIMQEIQAEKRELNNILNSKPEYQPKINMQQSNNTKIVLYYATKQGNSKVLCSKVIKDEDATEAQNLPKPSKIFLEREPVAVKIGPKLTLQSANLKDNDQCQAQNLSPGTNEKFTVPWLSWSDRVKLKNDKNKTAHIESSLNTQCAENLSLKKSNSTNDGLLSKHIDMQKREFSRVAGKEQRFDQTDVADVNEAKALTEETDTNRIELWNKSNGMRVDDVSLSKNFEKQVSSSTTTNRFYSTNSTRGVLGPEGTVMVKLRRLPKISIPEPKRICDEDRDFCADSTRADGVLRLKPKKLPKLLPVPCPRPPTAKMKDSPRLVRPRSRGTTRSLLSRICPPTKVCIIKRADDGLETLPKKLPKIEPKDCFPCDEPKMTSPPLVRLKAKPVPPPPPCKEVKDDLCAPRADEGLKVKRKNLPPLQKNDCCPVCPPDMVEGEPLKRLKKAYIPEPKNICYIAEDLCPPRADEVLGYQMKKKKLQTLILNAKNNNMSWREFKLKCNQSRCYATDSKCNMCCYSDKKVHPDTKSKSEVIPSELDKFEGRLLSGPDGKIQAYTAPKEITDTSTGSTLKIIRKPIGAPYWKEEHLHEELLKSGFTTFNDTGRKYSSLTSVARSATKECDIPPIKVPLTDFNVKRLQKREGFDDEFPPDCCVKDLKECKDPCEDEVRMDDVMNYEVKPKRLPTIPKGNCGRAAKRSLQPAPRLKRLKKIPQPVVYRSGGLRCDPPPCYRSDDHSAPKPPKKLAVLTALSNCPPPVREHPSDNNNGFKRLPKYEHEDPPQCIPPTTCSSFPPRSDAGKDLYVRKTLPYLKPMDCPKKKLLLCSKSPPLVRLAKIPYKDDIPSCIPKNECQLLGEPPRADEVSNYQVKKKKLKTILKSSNRSFSTLPDSFVYRENFTQFEAKRPLSLSSHSLQSNKKECKKLGQAVPKHKCSKFKIDNCKQAKNISCKKKRPPRQPCSKQNSPYPAFSECKDHDRPDLLTECPQTDRHLQPRWPILSEIKNQKPPPPYQGKIDPKLQEECIAKKLNIKLEGTTKTCDNFDEPEKPVLTKEMYDAVIKNPPYGECDCANEGEAEKPPPARTDGPCKPVVRSLCPDPEIECTLSSNAESNMSCNKDEESKETKAECTKDAPKLSCKKKSQDDAESRDECREEEERNVCKDLKDEDPCKQFETGAQQNKPSNIKIDCKKIANDKGGSKGDSKPKKCKQPTPKKCQQPKTECRSQKKECEDNKAKKSKKSKTSSCVSKSSKGCKPKSSKGCVSKSSKGSKAKSGKDSKSNPCRNVKACKKKTDAKKKGKPKKCSDLLKEDKHSKKGKPKKCSDLLKADKPSKKAKPKKCSDLLKESKPDKKKKMASLCNTKPCTPKSKGKKSSKGKAVVCAVTPPVCPAQKSFIDKILDFFRARPNCPAPDQWKKDKLRKKAEEAAAAAGYELCEKKKPKMVTVVCKKTGIRDCVGKCKSKNRGAKTGRKSCKREKSTCAPSKNTCAPKKKQSKASTDDCLEECKVASVVKAKECPEISEEECISEEDTSKGGGSGKVSKSGMKCKLPRQKFCKPPARQSCKEKPVVRECTTVPPPYPCFSECRKQFPKIPITECTEQDLNVKRKGVTYDYDDPKKGTRTYSTLTTQRRHYSSNANRGKNDDPFSIFNITDDSLKDMENNELALRILAVVKEGMKSMALSNQDNKREMYYYIFKELESLCEQELYKNFKNDVTFDSDNQHLKTRDLLSSMNKENLPADYKTFHDTDQTIMVEAVKNFCKTIFTIPDLSTKSYEESERIKTERLQKQLDDILDYYKTQ